MVTSPTETHQRVQELRLDINKTWYIQTPKQTYEAVASGKFHPITKGHEEFSFG